MIIAKKYEEIKLLGEGTYGKAFLVRNREDKSLAVVKTIDLGNISEDAKNESLQESQILQKLEHQNIIRFIEVIVEKTSKTRNTLHIVMDYADGGDLSQKIKAQNGVYFKEKQILDWFTQICLAIKHIHDRKILHRDLKSQNIFLTKNGIVKLGDFGIAKCLNQTIDKAKTLVGTPYYLSPEIINNQPYDFKSDIWSLGVLLYEMCALTVPFDAPNIPQLSMKIINGNYNPIPSQYSKELKNLVNDMLNVNSSKRPSIHDILKKGFIRNRIRGFLNEVDFNKEFSHTILHNFNVFKKKDKDTISSNYYNNVSSNNSNYNKFNGKNSNNNYSNHNNHQKPVIKRDDKNNCNNVNNINNKKNYHYRSNDIDINKNNIANSDENIAALKKNLCGEPIEKNYNSNANKNDGKKGYYNNNNNGHINKISNIETKYSKNSNNSNNNYKKYEDSSKISAKKSNGQNDPKKIDRSDSKGSESKEGNNNQLKDFMKNMREKMKKNPQENDVIWMKGMKEYFQSSDHEKESLKNSENHLKKMDNKDLKDYLDSQQMLLEYEKLQKDDIENDINLYNNNNDDDADESFDENIIASYYLNKQINNEDDNKNYNEEKYIDEKIWDDIFNEKDNNSVFEFANILKKYINDDIIFFDFDDIAKNIKKDWEQNKNCKNYVNIDKFIDKIPDVYYFILKGKL